VELSGLTSIDSCATCGTTLSATMRYCPTCRTDAGAPNVRKFSTEEYQNALLIRFTNSKLLANTRGLATEFGNLDNIVSTKSGVVVTMPASIARKLFEDSNALYDNYERLVGANARRPADPNNDRQRCSVGALLFGSYANKIVYGVLSLTGEGLPSYGDIHCRLRSITIDKRTSFLETNSFKFIEDHNLTPSRKLPVGYMACWKNRYALVLSKLADSLLAGQTESDWQKLLVYSDGYNRDKDDFIEAHIYENFDRNAIESMVVCSSKKLSRAQELDRDIALELFDTSRKRTI
jgi:hypothetical protein